MDTTKFIHTKWKGLQGLLFILILFVSYPVFSQKKGKIEIIADQRIEELLKKHIEFNKRIKTVPGYRILIASLSGNNSKYSAFKIKDVFLSEYPNAGAYIVFEEPNFKVKVGNFRTRLEAFAFYQLIKNQYPCTIIKDNVFFSEIRQEDVTEENESEEK